MTKLWDIINAVTELGEWKVLDQGKSVGTPQYDVCHAPKQEFSKNTEACIEYIATFDPEHIALMEAVIEAGDSPISGPQSRMALDTYRKERGLNG